MPEQAEEHELSHISSRESAKDNAYHKRDNPQQSYKDVKPVRSYEREVCRKKSARLPTVPRKREASEF
jgi:hypothetical protein